MLLGRDVEPIVAHRNKLSASLEVEVAEEKGNGCFSFHLARGKGIAT